MKYITQTAAAAALGVPVSAIKQAKKQGAGGFSINGEIDTEKLCAWLLTKGKTFEPVESLDNARAKLAAMQAKRLEREMELEGGEVIGVNTVQRALSDVLAHEKLQWLSLRAKSEGWHFARAHTHQDEGVRTAECERILARVVEECVQTFHNVVGIAARQLNPATNGQKRAGTPVFRGGAGRPQSTIEPAGGVPQ